MDPKARNSHCSVCLNVYSPVWMLDDFSAVTYEEDSSYHESDPKDAVCSADSGCLGCQLITQVFQYDLNDPTVCLGSLEITRPRMNIVLDIFHDPNEDNEKCSL